MIAPVAGGVTLDVRVVPRSGRPGLAGSRGNALLVRLSAAPVEGAANDELIRVLADVFRLPRRRIAIVSGARGRLKRVRVEGVSGEEAAAILRDYL